MLQRPKKRSCPSCRARSFWKVWRQPPGDRNGNRPSSTSTRASADQNVSLSKPAGPYFLPGAAGAAEPRKALKNSDPAGSTTSTSPFLLNVAL
jgi:hypothetical protein